MPAHLRPRRGPFAASLSRTAVRNACISNPMKRSAPRQVITRREVVTVSVCSPKGGRFRLVAVCTELWTGAVVAVMRRSVCVSRPAINNHISTEPV